MITINAKEAQNNFGQLMNSAVKEPVVINKHGKPAAVLISYEEFEAFNKYEDLYWELKATKASEEGFLSKEESANFLKEMMNNFDNPSINKEK